MDVQLLAETLTELLRPALPFLHASGKKAAEKAVEKLGSEVWESAKKAWGKLRRGTDGTTPAEAAARDLAAEPGDADAQAALRFQLKKLLASDPTLAAELAALVAGAPGATVAGGQVAVGRDVHGNVIVVNLAAGPMDSLRYWRGLGEPGDDELNAATQRYLDLLVDLYRYLDFRGMGISDRVPLRLPLLEMYVPLKARIEMPEGETWTRELRLAGRRPTDDETEAIGERLSAPRSALELLAEHDGLIVLGDPGAGKTTFLKLLALTLATGQGESLGLGNRLPVLLPLSAYATALEQQRDVPLEAFLDRYYQEDRGVALPIAAMLKRSLERGGTVLLFDGLDEVRELDRRHVVVDRVKDFYCLHRRAGNKFVVTSRVVGYREVRPEAEGLGECTLVDFEDDDVEEFVEKWTAALERAAAGATPLAAREAERERQELLAAVRTNPGVRSLASNPLLLTILALMKRQDVALPERRVELYETYVVTLLKHWNLARGLDRRGARDLDVVETVKVLAPVALWMHKASAGRGLVKERDLFRELERIFECRGLHDPASAARMFLGGVRRHAGLLLERGGRQYGFIHLTLQEYLAAVALAQKGQQAVDGIVEELAAHVDEDAWHEVTLLTVAYLGIVQQREEASSAVVQELLRLPSAASVVLAGQAVADSWPGGVSEKCRQQVVGALLRTMRDDQGAPAPRRAGAARALADVGDPRYEIMAVDGMEFCRVPAGPFMMGSDDRDDWAMDREKPLHEVDVPYDFWMARYPISAAQFRAFVEDTGQEGQFEYVMSQPGNEPVRVVRWYEAWELCRWLTRRWRGQGKIPSDLSVVLPSEAEWEKAARGGTLIPASPMTTSLDSAALDGRIEMRENAKPIRRYPWGDDPDPNLSNYGDTCIGDVTALGCFRGGASPYGCEEMSGNIFEWTRSLWGKEVDKPLSYPYNAEDGREALDASSESRRVLRGGWFGYVSRYVRAAYRNRHPPRYRNGNVGFRVALSPFTSEL